ncbi:hypothetical protein Cylst_1334 [Cylindrospermum stagnale PCC 7417]|uniref:Uncharacterized protein n=1 Tax=Cylindrospermum stagnale PCC 7417 TaxID=56107 RepID=K9WUZ1_9NOST|nr:hypothetical protein [Cylindrospermum stagnale]AFZ23624.1 hypothetical protein Cylst_1334 [Cylindrospermum stagnale PCC 7417]
MSGCEAYQIRPLEKFSLSFEKVVKSHYRKNKQARVLFETLIDEYITILRKQPLFDESDSENFPKGCYKPDFDFRKIRFFMPDLRGASRKGRLMYVVHQDSCSVFLVWVYTHEEYPKRPSDGELREQLLLIEKDVLVVPPSLEL